MSGPRRVILRILESEMNFLYPGEFVDFYFTTFPSDAASDPTRHFIHYQPPNVIPHANAKVHIVIDIETQDLRKLYAYQESIKQNLLQKIREYSDDFYPWGQSRGNKNRAQSE
ncbi:hypothetical protein ACJ72_03975 [Emergomyces africanus]|uniref:Uncharacterized protein n=1 Tax=Emergomyces africanus TaxID=1955775 RepID=A0A1B7NY35_9EURO|nr:hypothetical protein ACJ72_03975 [Emergomyces africanus]